MRTFVGKVGVIGVIIAAAFGVTSCSGYSAAAPTGGNANEVCSANTICMIFVPAYSGPGEGSFSPATLTVAKGTTVTFTNKSGVTHNVIFDTNAPSGGDITSIDSGSQTRTFATVGTSTFHCSIHAGMSGQIVVQ
jgi:plastocyanin